MCINNGQFFRCGKHLQQVAQNFHREKGTCNCDKYLGTNVHANRRKTITMRIFASHTHAHPPLTHTHIHTRTYLLTHTPTHGHMNTQNSHKHTHVPISDSPPYIHSSLPHYPQHDLIIEDRRRSRCVKGSKILPLTSASCCCLGGLVPK